MKTLITVDIGLTIILIALCLIRVVALFKIMKVPKYGSENRRFETLTPEDYEVRVFPVDQIPRRKS